MLVASSTREQMFFPLQILYQNQSKVALLEALTPAQNLFDYQYTLSDNSLLTLYLTAIKSRKVGQILDICIRNAQPFCSLLK